MLENMSFPDSFSNSKLRSKKHVNIVNYLHKQKHLHFCRADKGGCLVILNKADYINLCMNHLNDTKTYKLLHKYDDSIISQRLAQLTSKYKDILLPDEIRYITNPSVKTSHFYVLPKLHKCSTISNFCKNLTSNYIHIGNCPHSLSSRPIVSNVSSATSRLSKFINNIINPISTFVPSFIKNSFDLLPKLPKVITRDTKFLCLDVKSLYTIIPKQYGLQAVKFWLELYPDALDKRFTHNFLIDALDLILSHSVFAFQNDTYQQLVGTVMGTNVAPTYAHLTMGYFEEQLRDKCLKIFGNFNLFQHYYRYLDDILLITDMDNTQTSLFIDTIQSIHKSFQFSHTISDTQVNFLDITIFKHNNTLQTDIFYKETDAFRYLHFLSHHPRHTKRNVPYVLANRINMLVSTHERKLQRFSDLKSKLLCLKYPSQLIDDAITKTQKMKIIKKSETNMSKIPFVFTFSSENYSFFRQHILPIIATMNSNSFQMCPINVFPSLRQLPNLLFTLNHRNHFSINPCHRNRCKTCFLIPSTHHSVILNNFLVIFNTNMSCTTKNLVYCIKCNSCDHLYVGQTSMSLCNRMTLHRQHVNQPLYAMLHVSKHLRDCGNTYSVFPLFNCFDASQFVLNLMEKYFISKIKPTLNRI
jgi:hypothetical protein